MRIFLTGGTGFIGSHFLKQAQAAGHEVIALRREGSQPRIPLPQQPQWVTGDLANFPEEALAGCEALVHLAAHGVMNPVHATWDDCFFWNVTAPLKLWQQAHLAGTRRFVICGSCFEYGLSAENYDYIPPDAPLLPTGPYHASKAAATMAAIGFCLDRNVILALIRPFHVFGAGEVQTRFWPSLHRAALKGEDFPMTSGEQVRDFMPVEDVARAFVNALDRPDLQAGEPRIENLGTGRPQSLAEFAHSEWQRLGASGRIILGVVPQRPNEVMRYVAQINEPR